MFKLTGPPYAVQCWGLSLTSITYLFYDTWTHLDLVRSQSPRSPQPLQDGITLTFKNNLLETMLHIFEIHVQTQIGQLIGQAGILVTKMGADG